VAEAIQFSDTGRTVRTLFNDTRARAAMIAIAGGKGGCGKTTTTLGVARALAQRGQEPLVIDADCDMPDVHHVAGLDGRPGVDELAAGAPLDSVVRESDRYPGVKLLTAGSRDSVDAALARAGSWDGPTLVDCPPGSGPDAARPLRHARAAVVVTTDEPASLDDARRTVRAARRLDLKPAGVVVIRWTSQSTPAAVAGCRVLAGVPFADTPGEDPQVTRCWRAIAGTIQRYASVAGTVQSPESAP
jgi:septum site-determining protein MinD